MIDQNLLDELSDDMRKNVVGAFQTIANSGIIEMQIEQHKRQALAGSVSQSDAEIAEAVKLFRQRLTNLESLRYLGTT